jgi:Abortive infection alpha
MLADKVRVYRVRNWIRTVQKTERLLREAGLSANAVPPRLLLPIMEASSVEDNETLQDMWAGLLATASQDTDAVSPSFVETLKQLTPDEARHLQRVCVNILHNPKTSSLYEGKPPQVTFDTYERLGLMRREYELTWPGPEPLQLARIALREIDYEYTLTVYAANFWQACQGPRADESDATTRKSGH